MSRCTVLITRGRNAFWYASIGHRCSFRMSSSVEGYKGSKRDYPCWKTFFFSLWKFLFLQVMTHDRSLPCLLIPWHWCSWQQNSPTMETELSHPHPVHCAGAPVYNLSNGSSKKSQPFSPMFMGFVAHSVCPYHCPKTLALRADTWHHSKETKCPLSCREFNNGGEFIVFFVWLLCVVALLTWLKQGLSSVSPCTLEMEMQARWGGTI